MMSPSAILRHLEQRLPDFEANGTPELLKGGLVNYVWRVDGYPKPVIVKSAPPYVAMVPDIAFCRQQDDGRALITIEQRGGEKQIYILGADAIGAHAGEWIQFITFAIQNKLPVQSFADTIFIYPTFSEIAKKVFTRFLRTKLKQS